jgi:hypothetical protein
VCVRVCVWGGGSGRLCSVVLLLCVCVCVCVGGGGSGRLCSVVLLLQVKAHPAGRPPLPCPSSRCSDCLFGQPFPAVGDASQCGYGISYGGGSSYIQGQLVVDEVTVGGYTVNNTIVYVTRQVRVCCSESVRFFFFWGGVAPALARACGVCVTGPRLEMRGWLARL